MKRRIYIYFLIFCFIIPLFRTAQAEIPIWQIGEENDSFSEFVFPDTNIIEYTVPGNWESLDDPNDPNYGNWGKFPRLLFPLGEHKNIPQEIRINFDYLEDYNATTLIIRATTQYSDPNIRLKVFLGEIFIDEKHIEQSTSFQSYIFPMMGSVKKGLHQENKIIIKSSGSPDTNIKFDCLTLFSDDYPRTIDVDVERRGCIINTVIQGRDHGKHL